MEFIHNDVKLVHGNINPENVIITATGDWKLAGFNFASYDNYQTSAQVSSIVTCEYIVLSCVYTLECYGLFFRYDLLVCVFSASLLK